MEKIGSQTQEINDDKKDVFLIGGSDLEMYQIKKKLKRSGQAYVDKDLKWGAKAEDYKDEIKQILAEEKIPVAIELAGADNVKGLVNIDHHGDKSGNPASISQVMERAGIKMSFIDELVAANDSAYIPGMEVKIEEYRKTLEARLGSDGFDKLKNKLISLIRAKDRQIQGITSEHEEQAEEAIDKLDNVCNGLLTVVRLSHSKTATVADRLFGKYKNLIIISDDGEVNFYGDGKLCQDLSKKFEGSWSGGSGLGKSGENAYWGMGNSENQDVLQYVESYISENIAPTGEIKNYEATLKSKQENLPKSNEISPVVRRERGIVVIDIETVNSDPEFKAFLLKARVSRSKRGDGVFISGEYGTNTSKFRKYGIPVPGALIVPTSENIDEELKKFNLIIQDIKKSTEVEYEKLLLRDIEQRKELVDKYLEQVQGLLEANDLDDIVITLKDGRDLHNLHSSANKTGHLSRNEEIIFDLFKEEELGSSMNRHERVLNQWRSTFMSIEKVSQFIAEEARLKPLREKYRDRLLRLVEITKKFNNDLGDRIVLQQSIEFIGYLESYDEKDFSFALARKSIDSAYRIAYDKQVFEFDESDIVRLENLVESKQKEILERREYIWQLFQKINGVLTKRVVKKSAYAGKRFSKPARGEGESKWDEFEESTYFVDNEELTDAEYDWLQAKVKELPIVPGHYRLANDINELRPMIYPKSDSILEVWGKTGQSTRGVSPTGMLYKGKPENCNISPKYRWAYSWKLDGQEFTAKYESEDFFEKWNDPLRRAQRAFEEAGRKPEHGELEALAEAYKNNPEH